MKTVFRYRAEVHWRDEDARFIARVPAFKARGYGSTPGEAVDQAFAKAEIELDILQKNGQPIPESDIWDKRAVAKVVHLLIPEDIE